VKLTKYEKMADLFDFPQAGFQDRVQEVFEDLSEQNSRAACELEQFIDLMPKNILDQQELFTRSFDVQAITTLDVGYVLFGDDYKRGELLVNLNRELRDAGIDCRGELADYLPNILRLMPHLEDQDLVQDLVAELLVPALDSMIGEFDLDRIQKREQMYQKHFKTLIETQIKFATIYSFCLKALRICLGQDFVLGEKLLPVGSSGFLKSIDQELEIEDE